MLALLCNDHEMGGYTVAVSGHWLGKHVPVARQKILNNAAVDYSSGGAVFSVGVTAEIITRRFGA
jgi:hypothetical protein